MLSTRSGRNKVTATTAARRWIGALALAALVAAGCRPDPSTARGTAERFLDAHYVAIDLVAARELTSGLARHKVDAEVDLVRGQVIDETTRKPVVHYKLLEEHPQGEDAVNFLYLGSITVADAGGFERRWLVTVKREAPGWRVTNYQELVEQAPDAG
jgi:hypothetical protein